mmetsp:Transcript_20380/g.68104  ORF Transcript_20380/g.68104 Transcript_20380/m.68104 type:complete len:341 (+) Transcript_20380:1888-2910(+)
MLRSDVQHRHPFLRPGLEVGSHLQQEEDTSSEPHHHSRVKGRRAVLRGSVHVAARSGKQREHLELPLEHGSDHGRSFFLYLAFRPHSMHLACVNCCLLTSQLILLAAPYSPIQVSHLTVIDIPQTLLGDWETLIVPVCVVQPELEFVHRHLLEHGRLIQRIVVVVVIIVPRNVLLLIHVVHGSALLRDGAAKFGVPIPCLVEGSSCQTLLQRRRLHDLGQISLNLFHDILQESNEQLLPLRQDIFDSRARHVRVDLQRQDPHGLPLERPDLRLSDQLQVREWRVQHLLLSWVLRQKRQRSTAVNRPTADLEDGRKQPLPSVLNGNLHVLARAQHPQLHPT